MTASLLSILSILIGIVGALAFGKLAPRYTMGFTGNVIAGVFGSIFFIKSFGRLGFDPQHILVNDSIAFFLLGINLLISFLGGALAVYLAKVIYGRMNRE